MADRNSAHHNHTSSAQCLAQQRISSAFVSGLLSPFHVLARPKKKKTESRVINRIDKSVKQRQCFLHQESWLLLCLKLLFSFHSFTSAVTQVFLAPVKHWVGFQFSLFARELFNSKKFLELYNIPRLPSYQLEESLLNLDSRIAFVSY